MLVVADDKSTKARNNTCLFPFVLFLLVGGGLAIEMVGFVKLRPFCFNFGSQLCEIIPSGDDCAHNGFRHGLGNWTDNTKMLGPPEPSKAQYAFAVFVLVQGLCVCLQLLAFIAVCNRICSLGQIFFWFIPWKAICFPYGRGWVVVEIVSGVCCLTSCAILGACMTVEDIRKIDGFYFCLINGTLGVVKVIVLTIIVTKLDVGQRLVSETKIQPI